MLSIYHGFFTGAHRALNDADALLYLLSLKSHTDSKPYLLPLLHEAKTPNVRVLAVGAPFESKDILKGRRYSWDGTNRLWKKEIPKSEYAEEVKFLEQQVYLGPYRGKSIEIPLEDRFKGEEA